MGNSSKNRGVYPKMSPPNTSKWLLTDADMLYKGFFSEVILSAIPRTSVKNDVKN